MEELFYSDLRALVQMLAEANPQGLKEPEKLAMFLLCTLLRWWPFGAGSESPPVFGLTRREDEVLRWVARGKSNQEIAATLSIAPGTVKKHLDHIYAKLGVNTRTEAAVKVATASSLRNDRPSLA
jgi:DNA-binding CsgD family transcriptional regulator